MNKINCNAEDLFFHKFLFYCQKSLEALNMKGVCVCVCVCVLVVQSCLTLWPCRLLPASFLCPWGFSRQEYWSGLPCPPPGDLPDPGMEPRSPHCWQILYHLRHQGSPNMKGTSLQIYETQMHFHQKLEPLGGRRGTPPRRCWIGCAVDAPALMHLWPWGRQDVAVSRLSAWNSRC